MIDNPVGAGYSYTTTGAYVTSEEEMRTQFVYALRGFYDLHREYRRNPLWVCGESYAGKYIPHIAYELTVNATDIPLQGIVVGNGMYDEPTQYQSIGEMAFGAGVCPSGPIPRAREALEGKGPQGRPQSRFDGRLEAVAQAVGGGYCRLQMPLRLALGVGETVAGHRPHGPFNASLPRTPSPDRNGALAVPVPPLPVPPTQAQCPRTCSAPPVIRNPPGPGHMPHVRWGGVRPPNVTVLGMTGGEASPGARVGGAAEGQRDGGPTPTHPRYVSSHRLETSNADPPPPQHRPVHTSAGALMCHGNPLSPLLCTPAPNPLQGGGGVPLTRKRHIPPHPAQPQHTNDWAPRTRKRHRQEHRPQRPTERSDPTQHAKGRPGDCPGPRTETTTGRNVTRGGGGGGRQTLPPTPPPPGPRQCPIGRWAWHTPPGARVR